MSSRNYPAPAYLFSMYVKPRPDMDENFDLVAAKEMSSSSAASAQVACTYELVEEIILHLPLPQLLFAQTVCKYFHAVINESKKIKQALFFAPVEDQTIAYYDHDQRRQMGRKEPGWSVLRGGAYVTPILNPFLPWARREFDSDLNWRKLSASWLRRSYSLNLNQQANTKGGKDALSWSRMLLMQPPVRKIVLCRSTEVNDFQGLRVGHYLAAENLELKAKCNGCPYPGPLIKGECDFGKLPKFLKEITGWEMLTLLNAKGKDRMLLLKIWEKEVTIRRLTAEVDTEYQAMKARAVFRMEMYSR